MVRQCPARPTIADHVFHLTNGLANVRCAHGVVQEIKAVGHVKLVIALGVLCRHGGIVTAHFTHRRGDTEFVQQGSDTGQECKVIRMVFVVYMLLEEIRVICCATHARIKVRHIPGRIVPEFRIMHVEVGGIQTETVDTELQPKPHFTQYRILNFRIMQVQIRLLAQEIVHEILLALAVPLPSRSTKNTHPVIGRRSVRLRVLPDIPVGLRIAGTLAAFLEPSMLI